MSNVRFNDDSILARYFGRSSNYTDIPNQLFSEYNVKKGLRNDDGTGVRIGLTRISDVVGYTKDEKGNVIPCDGDLLYRGYSIKDLIQNRQGNYGFEETCFLLLFGYLPDREEFENFKNCLAMRYELPESFLANELLLKPARNLMNKLQSAVLSRLNASKRSYHTSLKLSVRMFPCTKSCLFAISRHAQISPLLRTLAVRIPAPHKK